MHIGIVLLRILLEQKTCTAMAVQAVPRPTALLS